MQVIVNADDLGMSREVNEAIFDLMARGRVTSASLLANAPATEEAIRTIPKFPQCSFGAHLNITEYEPLCRAADLLGLLDGEENCGRFLLASDSLRPRFERFTWNSTRRFENCY
jgi:chitin disaccharide deacetylase